MNIESANLAPKSVGNKPIAGDAPAAQDNGQNADSFASALKDQKKTFDNANDVGETKPQPQAATPAQAKPAEAKNDSDEQKELADFIGQYFPNLSANNDSGAYKSEVTAVLAADEKLTDSATTTLEDSVPAQDMGGLTILPGLVAPKPAPESGKLNFSPENAGQEVNLKTPITSWQFSQAKPEANLAVSDGSETFKQSLDSLVKLETTPHGVAVPEPKVESTLLQKLAEPRMEYASIAKPVSHPGWGKDLGEHIIWMTNKAISAAEIKMNPEHLGPISVRIDVNNDNQASILFTAQHPEAKEALETSIPKLREMLQGQQLNLVNVNISQNPGSHHGRSPAQPFLGNTGTDAGQQSLEPGEPSHVVTKGLLSLYA